MKPMIKYRSGTSREIPYIEKWIPEYTGRYMEPFLGSGTLYFHLEPEQAVINDINSKLMSFYKGVRDDYDNLRKELDEIETVYEYNRQNFKKRKSENPDKRVYDANERLYYNIRDMYNGNADKEFSDAFIYYFINKTAYSGMIRFNAKGDFDVPYGRYEHFNTQLITKEHSELLKKAEILNTNYFDVFNLAGSNDFMFLDLPYDCKFSDYENSKYKEGFTEDDQRKLAEDFRNLNCKALMIIGKTPLIEELYKDFIVDEYGKHYAINIKNQFSQDTKHLIITNYTK